MKKLLLLPLLLIMGCRSSVPKCEEDNTIETVREIMFEDRKSYISYKIVREMYGSDYRDKSINLSESSYEMMLNKEKEMNDYIESYISGDIKSIPNDILSLIEDNYNKLSITNIRTNSIDETSKSCDCSATFKIDNEIELNYTAQRNSDGEIYVEVER